MDGATGSHTGRVSSSQRLTCRVAEVLLTDTDVKLTTDAKLSTDAKLTTDVKSPSDTLPGGGVARLFRTRVRQETHSVSDPNGRLPGNQRVEIEPTNLASCALL